MSKYLQVHLSSSSKLAFTFRELRNHMKLIYKILISLMLALWFVIEHSIRVE